MITTNIMVRRQPHNLSINAKTDIGLRKLSRSKSDKEVVDFFVSLITCTDPSSFG